MQEEAAAYDKWLHVAELEEDFLKQRSKLHWLEVGDQNNTSFHNSIKTRQAQNTMKEIRCTDGRTVTSHLDIKIEAESFFSGVLNLVPPNFQGPTVEELKELLNFECSAGDCSQLVAEVTEGEIKKVLFSMPSNKSPGLDGYPCEFYKASWSIIAHDFLAAVKSVFQLGFLPKGVNSTILALIPKKTEALEMRDYRPIACCNVLYKVVSKLIANRLKKILPRVIAENQYAFVEGRLLMENVLLAAELVKDYHKESVSPRCAMKIDISKAFDSVQWSFLLNTLQAMGIPERFIHWIRLCITSPSFSVQVNGELAGYFQSTRGLRQGCSLSPYLFVICMNVLSLKMDKAVREKKFAFHPSCQSLALTHLCFADDLMVFIEGSKKSVEGVMGVFDEFTAWSGLSISLEKSSIFMAGVSEVEKGRILRNFPFAVGELPVRYLGLPLLTQSMKRQDFMPLIEKIRARICSWTSRFLSYAGRLQLIKSVLMSTVNFWVAAFRLPGQCTKEIDQICSAFLWSGPELKTSGAKVAWYDIYKPYDEGGLGIRPLKEVNMVQGLKLIWRLLTWDSLWGKWIKLNLLKKKSFWEVSMKSQASWIWKKLLKLRETAKSFHMKLIGNGHHTSFWYDRWSNLGVMSDLLGARGVIDMGIRKEATVKEVLNSRRRRVRHRGALLNEIEKELSTIKKKQSTELDVDLWRGNSGFKSKFSTHETWKMTRRRGVQWSWGRSVWFAQSTPKFAFMTWLASHNRLATMDRVSGWCQGVNTMCVLCKSDAETRNHLFFECSYSSQLWDYLMKGMLHRYFTVTWNELFRLITGKNMEKKKQFCLRYSFQAALYALWRERNQRRHGEPGLLLNVLAKRTDKVVRNMLSLLQKKRVKGYEDILQYWFATRL